MGMRSMMLFLEENWGSALVLAGVAAVAAAAARRLVKDKKAGKSVCGGCCGGCPSRGACRSGGEGRARSWRSAGRSKEEEIFTLKKRR